MVSVTNPPERIRLLNAVEKAFNKGGWTVKKMGGMTVDFEPSIGRIRLAIRCVDETRMIYASSGDIVIRLEGEARKMRDFRKRQLVVVFDRDFLGVSLANLIERQIFAVTLDDLPLVVGLAKWHDVIPDGAEPRQQYLLERCVEYAPMIARRCHDQGDLAKAVIWAGHAVRHSIGFTPAHYLLFSLLKEAGDLSGAAELGEEIRRYRPDDPQFLRGMADLERRRGDKAAAARWTARLTEQPTTPRSIEGILAKQRQKSGQPALSKASQPEVPVRTPKSGFARLFASLKRSASRED